MGNARVDSGNTFDYNAFNKSVAENFGQSATTDDNDTTGVAQQKKSGSKAASTSGKAGGAADKASAASVGAAATAGSGATAGDTALARPGKPGGSLDTGADVRPSVAQNKTEQNDLAAAGALATEVGGVPGAALPQILDSNPDVAAAQKAVAALIDDPAATDVQIDQAVKNLQDVLGKAGRADDVSTALTNALPISSGSSRNNLASVYASAAKLGIVIDDGTQVKDAASNAVVAKATRVKQEADRVAAQKAAAAQAASQSQSAASAGGGSGAASGSGGGGSASWDGNKITADSTTGANGVTYSGSGANFPNDTSKWPSWDESWAKALKDMGGVNSAQENEWLKEAIQTEASKTGLDARFILAVVMQESTGNVRVGSTNNGVHNPGLMQSHNGVSFSDNGDGGKASIFQMIKDGVEGTTLGDGSHGDGLVDCMSAGQGNNNMFAAARWYNSGTANMDDLNAAMGATANYPSDIAKRVMGKM